MRLPRAIGTQGRSLGEGKVVSLGLGVISVPADMREEKDSAGREASTVTPAHSCSVTHFCPR